MHVPVHHGQGGMAQVLLQEQDVTAVDQEIGGVGMPAKMGVEPGHAG